MIKSSIIYSGTDGYIMSDGKKVLFEKIKYTCLNCGTTFYRYKTSGRKPRFHDDRCRNEYNNKERANSKYEKAIAIILELTEHTISEETVRVWPKTFTITFVNHLGYKWIAKQWYKE